MTAGTWGAGYALTDEDCWVADVDAKFGRVLMSTNNEDGLRDTIHMTRQEAAGLAQALFAAARTTKDQQ